MADPGIGTPVRYWLHYHNLASSLYKQFGAAKALQDQYANEIIGTLEKNRMQKAIIQIGGGHLSVMESKTSQPLSLSKVQQLLHEYHKQVGGKDSTKEMMTFINANRGFIVKKSLKKTNIPTPNQAPVPLTLQGP
jgi:hypothetical protein